MGLSTLLCEPNCSQIRHHWITRIAGGNTFEHMLEFTPFAMLLFSLNHHTTQRFPIF